MKTFKTEAERQAHWDNFLEQARKKAAPDPRAAQNAANARKRTDKDADPV